MTRDAFQVFIDRVFSGIKDLNLLKGNDYSGSEDAFSNFKRNAKNLGLSKHQVWGVYAGKHWDAISTYLRGDSVHSEPIEGRIDDLILYLLLLRGMIQEDKDLRTVIHPSKEEDEEDLPF